MPFVKFLRDKRGYEYVYLVDASNNRGPESRPRLLYWFRTPPGIRVGRQPFDEEMQRALESQNPDLMFDWKKIVNTSPPPPDVEHWRERRRSQRAEKQSRAADAEEETSEIEGREETTASVEPVAERAPVPEPSRDAPPLAMGGKRRRRRGRHGRRPDTAIALGTREEKEE